jgi:hypothetical protein
MVPQDENPLNGTMLLTGGQSRDFGHRMIFLLQAHPSHDLELGLPGFVGKELIKLI